MRYLIDTNVFIRIIEDYDISDDTKNILEDYENTIYISSESIKEFVHLVQTERIILKKNFRLLDVFDLIDKFGLNVKYVCKEPLISSDTKFPKYRKHGLNLIYNH